MRKFSPRTRQGYPSSTTAAIKNWLPRSAPSVVYATEVLADSPYLYYRLSETSGTTVLDYTSNARNATYTNSPTLNQSPLISVDACVDFDGTNDYATFTTAASVTGDFTLECWVRADSFTSYPGVVSAWNANTSGNYGSAIVINTTGTVEIYAANSTFTGWSYTDNTSYTLSTGTTYHLVFVNDDTNNVGYLYVNGVLQYTAGSKTTAMGLFNSGKNLVVGRANNSGSYFDGKIDEVAVYTTALSASRILAHYNAGIGGVNGPPIFIEYMIVAGGGGAGLNGGGGGGAGGYRTSTTYQVNSTNALTVTVGGGGAGCVSQPTLAGSGGVSSVSGTGFTTVQSAGGGGGASRDFGPGPSAGGSGAGGAGAETTPPGRHTASAGNTPSTTPSQGNPGGNGFVGGGAAAGGGGGGAGATGGAATLVTPPNYTGGTGGAGTANSISGSSVTYAGGGGGAGVFGPHGPGGSGGGGPAGTNGTSGTTNTGGGGGAGGTTAGSGGSGIIILSWPDVNRAASTTTGSPTYTTSGGKHIYTFNASGSITF